MRTPVLTLALLAALTTPAGARQSFDAFYNAYRDRRTPEGTLDDVYNHTNAALGQDGAPLSKVTALAQKLVRDEVITASLGVPRREHRANRCIKRVLERLESGGSR